MSIESVTGLVGGLGLFLVGMWLMTEGLKVAAGPSLKTLLERWTNTRLRGSPPASPLPHWYNHRVR